MLYIEFCSVDIEPLEADASSPVAVDGRLDTGR